MIVISASPFSFPLNGLLSKADTSAGRSCAGNTGSYDCVGFGVMSITGKLTGGAGLSRIKGWNVGVTVGDIEAII